ncbi:hypothetical protein [Bacteroides clarus]|jgi:hypothetical protein|uniref:hypothetical protein n=1 Tax=Bacteroides clarus TaxID=626929 RepID=UPI00189A48EA|nr:hypothetical protein [Bacteroides clarus]
MRLSTALGHFRQSALPAPQAEESYMTGRMFCLFALAKITINSQQKKYSPKTLKEAFGEKLKYDENKTELLYQGFITQ